MSKPQAENDISIFLNQWEIYQYVVSHNFMAHQQIEAHLKDYFTQTQQPFRLLDVGCGDASLMLSALKETAIEHYTGLDLSDAALQLAKKSAEKWEIAASFHIGDLKDFRTAIQQEKYDYLVAGFSLHHLQAKEKQQFFIDCKQTLKPNGCLVLYDVVRDHYETRDDYLKRYCGNVVKTWDGIPPANVETINHHISTSDYPQSIEELDLMIRQAGFESLEIRFKDELEFHQLLLIQ